MFPKKAKDHIATTAEKLEYSEELVEAVITFYWENIRKCLTELKGTDINVHKLGVFKIKHWKIDKVEKLYKTYIAAFKRDKKLTFQRMTIMKENQAQLAKIKDLKKMLKENKLKKEQVKIRRYGPKKNLGKQKKNT